VKIAMIGQKGLPSTSGGVERHVEELGRRMVQKGHEVSVYCRAHYTDVSLHNYLGMFLIHKKNLNTKHLDAITHTLVCSIDSLFGEYDIVHYHAIGPATLSFIPKMADKKVVVTVHGLDWQREKWGKFAKLYLKLGEKASAYFPERTIVVSQVLRDYYKNRYGLDCAAIPNGVDIPAKLLAEIISKWGLQQDNYILFLARLVPEKGCHHLLKAWRQVKTDKLLVIAGGSSHSDDYVQKLHNDAGKNVIFTGFVQGQTLGELFSNAYLYVLPSEIEGLPISLLEAMSYALPCLVSNIPENMEVIGDTGFAFTNKNVDSLAEKLQFLIDSHQDAKAAGQKAFSRVEHYFNWDKVVNETEAVYREIIEKPVK
jgi:glycosyltransferase involved in cell wall biosynthesis